MPGIYKKYVLLSDEEIESGPLTREEVYENYIPLVLKIAKRFPPKFIERDEANSIGLIELVACLKRCESSGKKYTAKQLVKYVKQCVYQAIKHHCRKYRGKSLVRTKSRNATPVLTLPIQRDMSKICHDFIQVDLQDTIQAIVKNSTELVIINRLQEGGYTLPEIAAELGISRQRVAQLRDQIMDRLLCELKK